MIVPMSICATETRRGWQNDDNTEVGEALFSDDLLDAFGWDITAQCYKSTGITMPKSKADQIEAWLPRGWRDSTTGSSAKWKNLRRYHVAVMEDHEHQGKWKYRIGLEDSKVREYSQPIYSDEEAAKRAVLGKLCDKLGIR